MNYFDNLLRELLKFSKKSCEASSLLAGYLFALDRGWTNAEEVERYKIIKNKADTRIKNLWQELQTNYKKEFLNLLEYLDTNSKKLKTKFDHSDYIEFRENLGQLKSDPNENKIAQYLENVLDVYFMLKSYL